MKYLFTLFTGMLLLSCSSNTHFLEDASWLDGNWKREYNGVIQMEKWSKTENGFSGENLFVSGDTNVMNTYQIQKEGDRWTFTKSVAETDMQFSFALFSSNTDSIVFKNVENIWPQTIIYKKLSQNKMDLIVKGQDGTMQKNAALTFIRD